MLLAARTARNLQGQLEDQIHHGVAPVQAVGVDREGFARHNAIVALSSNCLSTLSNGRNCRWNGV